MVNTTTTTTSSTRNDMTTNISNKKIALLMGGAVNSEQGRAVIEGLVDTNQYSIVYAMLSKQEIATSNNSINKDNDTCTKTADYHHHTHHTNHYPHHTIEQYFTDGLGATIVIGDVLIPTDIESVLQSTQATNIYITTTTNIPIVLDSSTKTTTTTIDDSTPGIYQKAMMEEYTCIQNMIHAIVKQYQIDEQPRHIILSIKDDVQSYIEEEQKKQMVVEDQIATTTDDDDENKVVLLSTIIQPLYDGSIVPQYSAKGMGGMYAMQYHARQQYNITITCIKLPFLYSNFTTTGYCTPLPDEQLTKIHTTKYNIMACCGTSNDGSSNPTIDMMSVSDLSYIVPNIFANPQKYHLQNLRLVGEQLSMDTIAYIFSDIFGKDVIYNPLTPEEVTAALQSQYTISTPCMVQMFQYISHVPESLRHDVTLTRDLCFPRQPQTFRDWLLCHSESTAFQMVGLTMDAPEITYVTVFGATSPEGRSVIQGLLKDPRKVYRIRATTRHIESEAAQSIKTLDPDRIELIYANYDNIESCQDAVDGVDGVFLVTDFYVDAQKDMVIEERHARNVIDACEMSTTVKHLVFSTMESMSNMARLLQEDHALNHIIAPTTTTTPNDDNGNSTSDSSNNPFDAKARAAAYARTKRLSVTYVLLPCYPQHFFDMIVSRPKTTSKSNEQEEGGDEDNSSTDQPKFVMTIPLKDDTKVLCMNIDDLGPAVANIFDSYQVYAGHEIGLVTDFVSVAEVRDMINDVLLPEDNIVIETEEVTRDQWIEVKDTYMKDLGQLFVYMSHSDAVKNRHSIAKTMKLVPSARPLRQWIEQNINDGTFREKLGLH